MNNSPPPRSTTRLMILGTEQLAAIVEYLSDSKDLYQLCAGLVRRAAHQARGVPGQASAASAYTNLAARLDSKAHNALHFAHVFECSPRVLAEYDAEQAEADADPDDMLGKINRQLISEACNPADPMNTGEHRGPGGASPPPLVRLGPGGDFTTDFSFPPGALSK